MGHRDYFKHGSHNVICDVCGKKRKREECRKTWDGYIACLPSNCWYPKHAADFPIPVVKGEMQPVRDSRPAQPLANVSFVYSHLKWEEVTDTWESINRNWEDV